MRYSISSTEWMKVWVPEASAEYYEVNTVIGALYRWLLGIYVSMFGFWESCQGILEGAFHQAYISNATNLLLSPTHYIGYASASLGMFLYWLLMPRLKEFKV